MGEVIAKASSSPCGCQGQKYMKTTLIFQHSQIQVIMLSSEFKLIDVEFLELFYFTSQLYIRFYQCFIKKPPMGCNESSPVAPVATSRKVHDQNKVQDVESPPAIIDSVKPDEGDKKNEKIHPKIQGLGLDDKISDCYLKLPDLLELEFKKEGEKMLGGYNSKEKTSANATTLSIAPEDCFENIGVVSLWYQNFCYTDGQYNNNNYKVQRGTLGNKQAYRVYGPEKKFTKFMGSHHALVFKLSQVKKYNIYCFQDNSLDLAAQIPQKDVQLNDWTLVPSIKVSQFVNPIVYVVVPADEIFTPFYQYEEGVLGATVYNEKIRIQLGKFILPSQPPVPEDFNEGPGTHANCYNPNRNFFYFLNRGCDYLVWSDQQKNFYLTEINRLRLKSKTIQIQGKSPKYVLGAACTDGDNIFYTEVEEGNGNSKTSTRKMNLVKCNFDGSHVSREPMQTDKDHFNIYKFDTCHLAYNEGVIGMVTSRTMTQGSDGLNHQGAFAAVFDSKTLKLIKSFGQTSGHSFANSLIQNNRDGGFIGMDLGDNYPRGIHHWVFNQSKIDYKVVYSFKAQHSKDAKGFPKYEEASKNGQTYYKWSNDNRTYTQLAAPGVIAHESGNIIVFAGENDPSPLDSSAVGSYNNCPRNIGFIKTSKNIKQPIISEGPEEDGGFYDFGGKWQVLKNKGVMWLTKFKKGQNASRVKAGELYDKIFIIFELWTETAYLNTQYMIVDTKGKVIIPNTVIPFKIRLQKSDDIYITDRSVLIFSGSKGKVVNRYEIFIPKT